MTGIKVLVCGGRDYSDWERLKAVLDKLHERKPIGLIICGGATGADELAARWAHLRNIPTRIYPAEWKRYGRKAGPIRNQQMLDEQNPDRVLAFRGGKGTEDMVYRAHTAKVRCLFVDPRPATQAPSAAPKEEP